MVMSLIGQSSDSIGTLNGARNAVKVIYIQAEKFPLLPLNPIALSYPTEVTKMGKNRKEGANS
jgi:hypothetical protein